MTSITLENLSSFITTKGVDTLMISKLLRQFDFSENQAEVVSELIRQTNCTNETSIDEKIQLNEGKNKSSLADLASKEDLLITKKELELQLEKVRSEIEKVRSEIAHTKSDLIKWVAGLMIANTGLLFTLIKLFTNI